MADHFEALGPFRFTATMLIYDSGHEFKMIPYDQIISAELERPATDDPAAILVRTRKAPPLPVVPHLDAGNFDPTNVLARIHSAAHLDDTDPSELSVSSVGQALPVYPESSGKRRGYR